MRRQQRVRQISTGLSIALVGTILLITVSLLNQFDAIVRIGLTVVFAIIAVSQFFGKDTKGGIIYAIIALAIYFLYPFIAGSINILAILIIIAGLALAVYAWLKATI